MTLLEKITTRSAVIGVVGLGYVGLPLAVLQANTGFPVLGFDEASQKVDLVNQGVSYILDVQGKDLARVVDNQRFTATQDYSRLKECDIVLICVPTPLTPHQEPDISAIKTVTQYLAQYAQPHILVILESTSYPGTTEEVILPKLENAGLRVGHDLFLAFSPERVDPGNPTFSIHNTAKLVGGVTLACRDMAVAFYTQSVTNLFPVSSPRVAELAKVFENVFRSVNIALVNELAMLCDRMDVGVFEVIDAASTKNFGFMPFYPGPGVGGHCVPLDPYYLAWKAKAYDFHPRFIELAGEINNRMPYFVVNKLQRLLNAQGRCLKGSTILILGVTYKSDSGDPRESPATKIMTLLQQEGAILRYVDPFTPTLLLGKEELKGESLTPEVLSDCHCALILTAHTQFNYDLIVQHAPLVFDTRNGTRSVKESRERIVLLA